MRVATNSFYAWVLASRPKTLGAITCPILVGNALAISDGVFSPWAFALILLDGLLLQVLANIINDYGDFIKGSDNAERIGPPRAMQMGWITKGAMHKGIALVFLSATLIGLLLVFANGPSIIFFGAIAIALSFSYTLGPMPLAYLGFIEVVVFLVFGPLAVLATYFAQTKAFSAQALVASLSPGFMCSALLLTNNLRDMIQDKKNHKLTMAVRCGERCSRFTIVALLILALSSPLILVMKFSYGLSVLFSCLGLILPARYFSMILHEPISHRFNLMLGAIGKSLYLFGILFSIGIIYGAP